jgi:hypothetical protein
LGYLFAYLLLNINHLINFILGLSDKVIEEIKVKKTIGERLKFILEKGLIESADKEVGQALYIVASKINAAYNHRVPILIKYITTKKLLDAHQIDVALEFLKKKGDLDLTEDEFEASVGVFICLFIIKY